MKTDRRNELLKSDQCFYVITPEGKRFHVYTNEGLEAKLESGRIPVDSIIQISKSTNHSDPYHLDKNFQTPNGRMVKRGA